MAIRIKVAERSDDVSHLFFLFFFLLLHRQALLDTWAFVAKLSEVSPNARSRQTQCKGGGGKKLNIAKKRQATGIPDKTWKQHVHETEINEMQKQSSHGTAFLATLFQLLKVVYQQNIFFVP